MKRKTEYRIVNDSYFYYIEHKVNFIFFSLWKRVWKPYFCDISGRDAHRFDLYVISEHPYSLEEFAREWPYIEDYFKWAKKTQASLEEEAYRKIDRFNKDQEYVKYL